MSVSDSRVIEQKILGNANLTPIFFNHENKWYKDMLKAVFTGAGLYTCFSKGIVKELLTNFHLSNKAE